MRHSEALSAQSEVTSGQAAEAKQALADIQAELRNIKLVAFVALTTVQTIICKTLTNSRCCSALGPCGAHGLAVLATIIDLLSPAIACVLHDF